MHRLPMNDSFPFLPGSSSNCDNMRSPEATKRQRDWWQRSVMQRTCIDFVENDLECVISQSPFLKKNASLTQQAQEQQQQQQQSAQAAVFHRSEIETGELQGKGGFSVVYEITGFHLNPIIEGKLSLDQRAARQQLAQTCMDPLTGKGRYAIKHLQEKMLYLDKLSNNNNTTITTTDDDGNNNRNNSCSTTSLVGKIGNDNAANQAQLQQPHDGQEQGAKNGVTLTDFSYAASDLGIEASFLSALHHPNILSLRGLPVDGIRALGDGRHDGFFLITDRLVETLDQRLSRIARREQQQKACECPQDEKDADNEHHHTCLHEKMDYALQLAQALEYLHERRIVYRDLKPQNIGFTSSGRLQLFDFGLTREIPAGGCHLTDLYEMSDLGTRRYMAVEVINDHRYNVKADVYGWAMVFWEMLTNRRPYSEHSIEEHRISVCQGGERPPINKTLWPPALQSLLQQSWVESIQDRLSIKEASTLLRLVLLRQRRLPPNQQHQQQAAPKINMSQISHFQSEPMFPPPPPLWSPPLSQQDIPSPGSPKGVMENVFLTSNNKKATPATSVIAVHDEVLLEQQQQQQQQTPSSNSPPPFRSGSGRRNHEKKAFTFTGNIPSFLKLPNEGIFPAIDLASPMVSVQEMFKSDVIM